MFFIVILNEKVKKYILIFFWKIWEAYKINTEGFFLLPYYSLLIIKYIYRLSEVTKMVDAV